MNRSFIKEFVNSPQSLEEAYKSSVPAEICRAAQKGNTLAIRIMRMYEQTLRNPEDKNASEKLDRLAHKWSKLKGELNGKKCSRKAVKLRQF